MPRVKTSINLWDILGSLRARTGIARNKYRINPGLYCVGNPSHESPVLVTANYKLSFDALRKELSDTDAWILVADTRGVNVWCAAGKKTFSADEVALQVRKEKLSEIVAHRELILPQLAATGVAAFTLPEKCGFMGIFGPLRAADIPLYLKNGNKAEEAMRTVTFSLKERLVLVPVEIALLWKILAIVLMVFIFISGIGPDIYSLQSAFERGATAVAATILAVLAGCVATPVFLPWIPGRQFWLKGLQMGALAGLLYIFSFVEFADIITKISILIWICVTASYTGMNFTGATPYTSLSGVEQEMRRGLPLQIAGSLLAVIMWISAPFIK